MQWPQFMKKKRVKTPTVIQMEAVECGAAALAIILAYYGKFVSLEELRISCGVNRDGSNALNMVKAARSYGLASKGIKVELEELPNLQPPFVVFWNFNHFLVVEGWSKKGVYINDPSSGPRMVSHQEFDESYTGVAITFHPGHHFVRGGRPPELWLAIKQRLSQVKWPSLYICLAGFFLLLPALALPTIMQIFYDNVLGNGDLSWLPGITSALIYLAFLTGALTWLEQFFLNRLNIKLSTIFSSEFLWHILRLPISFYAQRFGGEIANRVSLNSLVAATLTGNLATTAINLILIIFYAVIMIKYDALIAAVGIFAGAINLLTLWLITRTRSDAYARMRQETGKSIGFAIGALQHIEAIKAAGNEGDFFARWAGYYAKGLNANQEIGVKDVTLTSIPALLQSLSTPALLGIGAWRIMNGDLTIGMLLALQGFLSSFLTPLNQMINLGTTLQTLRIDVARLNDVLKNPVDPVLQSQEEEQVENSTHKMNGYLQLEHITFGYSPLSPPLIENFSLFLKPGQRVALVGPSGCGKSTLAKLITGLYEPWQGRILYDHKPREAFPRSSFTNSVASVDQDIFLFSGSIKDNLTLWDNSIPEHDIFEAARDAVIHEEIVVRPDKYQSQLIEGGSNLSGGQKQRLEIARALVTGPSILVLDEATSALDSKSEEEISRNIKRRGCTCVMIAHRLSTIRDCDEIIVLSNGKIVQRGTHEELKAAPGTYRNLIEKETGPGE